jgi:hypothetical protein
MKDDLEFMERITRDLAARKAACQVLGVSEGAGKEDLKKAYRKASMKYHPDLNHDTEPAKRFVLVKCAYDLLAEDKPCQQLLEEINTWDGVAEDAKYKLDNQWKRRKGPMANALLVFDIGFLPGYSIVDSR